MNCLEYLVYITLAAGKFFGPSYFDLAFRMKKSAVCCTYVYTVIPYRARTGSKQGFPCVVFLHRENPVFITGFPGDDNRFFPVGNTTQVKPCFHYRDGFAVYSGKIYTAQYRVCFLSFPCGKLLPRGRRCLIVMVMSSKAVIFSRPA